MGIFPQTLVGQVFNLSLRRWDDCAPDLFLLLSVALLGRRHYPGGVGAAHHSIQIAMCLLYR